MHSIDDSILNIFVCQSSLMDFSIEFKNVYDYFYIKESMSSCVSYEMDDMKASKHDKE